MAAFATVSHAANLGGYTFEPPPPPATANPTGVAEGVTFSPFSYVGTGTSNFPVGYEDGANPQNNGGKSFSSDQWSPTAPGPAPGTEPYWQFTITPDLDKVLNLDSLSFVVQRNGNASPTNLLIRSSQDGFSSNVADFVLGSGRDTRNIWQEFSAPLGEPDFYGLAAPITFRLYAYGEPPNLQGNQAENLDIDDVFIHGEAIPTPALLPGLLGMGVGAWRKRKKQATI